MEKLKEEREGGGREKSESRERKEKGRERDLHIPHQVYSKHKLLIRYVILDSKDLPMKENRETEIVNKKKTECMSVCVKKRELYSSMAYLLKEAKSRKCP